LYHKELWLYTVIQGISEVIKYNDKLIYSLIDCADPYWMLIAHEMIHLELFFLQEHVKLCSERIISSKPSKLDESFCDNFSERNYSKIKWLVCEIVKQKRLPFNWIN